jgi:hypothetical protein
MREVTVRRFKAIVNHGENSRIETWCETFVEAAAWLAKWPVAVDGHIILEVSNDAVAGGDAEGDRGTKAADG